MFLLHVQTGKRFQKQPSDLHIQLPQPYLNPVPKRKPGTTLGVSQGEFNTGNAYADTKGLNPHEGPLGHSDIITAGCSHYLPRELGEQRKWLCLSKLGQLEADVPNTGTQTCESWAAHLVLFPRVPQSQTFEEERGTAGVSGGHNDGVQGALEAAGCWEPFVTTKPRVTCQESLGPLSLLLVQ